MSICRPGFITLMIAATMMAAEGCKRTHEPAAPPPPLANEQRVAEVRETLSKQNPDAVVGPVIETLPDSRLAAIGEVPAASFHHGDIVTFIDSQMNVIDTGTVVRVTADQVHVRYDVPDAAHRAPRKGDLGVLVPRR